jgi:hypothetical protein
LLRLDAAGSAHAASPGARTVMSDAVRIGDGRWLVVERS